LSAAGYAGGVTERHNLYTTPDVMIGSARRISKKAQKRRKREARHPLRALASSHKNMLLKERVTYAFYCIKHATAFKA
jgi:hypothetical protein